MVFLGLESWLRCSESVLCLILLCGVGASCLVVAVLVLRWLLKFLPFIMVAVAEFYVFCCALFGSWMGAVGRAFEVMEMNGEEAILEILEDGDLLLEDENGDDVWQYAVLAVNGEEAEVEAEVETEDDREWLRWWRIGRAQQEREEMWRRVWHELDERDREAFGDVLDYYGELLWYAEDLGDEYVRGWDTVVEEFGDIDIYYDDWEGWG